MFEQCHEMGPIDADLQVSGFKMLFYCGTGSGQFVTRSTVNSAGHGTHCQCQTLSSMLGVYEFRRCLSEAKLNNRVLEVTLLNGTH